MAITALLSADLFSEQILILLLITRTCAQVWITDSCPMQAELVNGKGPFEVLSLAPLIASQIDMELEPVARAGVSPPRWHTAVISSAHDTVMRAYHAGMRPVASRRPEHITKHGVCAPLDGVRVPSRRRSAAISPLTARGVCDTCTMAAARLSRSPALCAGERAAAERKSPRRKRTSHPPARAGGEGGKTRRGAAPRCMTGAGAPGARPAGETD